MTTQITIANVTTSVLTYQGQRVVTNKQLAAFYGCLEVSIRENFSANKDRFEEGKHYIKIKGSQVSDFVRLSGIPTTEIPEATTVLMLWTEKGAARHAKMLSTEKAWEVFEELEDGYFRLKQSQALENLTPELARQIGGIMKAVVHKQIEDALRESLPQLVHGAISASHTGVRHGITAGQIMETYGLQKIKGGAQHLSRCLVKLACLIDGSGRAEMGTRTAKLFDPDRVAAQMKIGGMIEQYKKYVQERKGQGNLFAMRPI